MKAGDYGEARVEFGDASVEGEWSLATCQWRAGFGFFTRPRALSLWMRFRAGFGFFTRHRALSLWMRFHQSLRVRVSPGLSIVQQGALFCCWILLRFWHRKVNVVLCWWGALAQHLRRLRVLFFKI